MQQLITISILATALVAALWLGKVLPLWLPVRWSLLDRKPFNCRSCTTFHLLWAIVGIGAWYIGSISLFAKGIVLAFIVFGVVFYMENKKIEK